MSSRDSNQDEFVCTWEHEERIITFSWLGEVNAPPHRVYAFASTEADKMLLVGDHGGKYWLPGGGLEPGETPVAALVRELQEEAAATVLGAPRYLGTQRAEDPLVGVHLHSFYSCRVRLAPTFTPEHEITERHLVDRSDFLDTLFWGRSDPKAHMLLTKALQSVT